MAELKPLKGGYYVWKYVPSIPISVISLLLWLAIGGALSWRMWKTRTWFCTSLVIGAFSELMVLFYENSLNTHGQMKAIVIELTFEVVEAIGYAARASAANKTGYSHNMRQSFQPRTCWTFTEKRSKWELIVLRPYNSKE